MQKRLLVQLCFAFALCLAGSASALTRVNANVAVDTTWCDGVNTGPIILEQPVFVTGDATLTILPGCIVRGQPRTGLAVAGVTAGTPGALVVSQDGRVIADGSATNPIIMTTAAVDNDDDGIPDDLDGNGFLDPHPGFQPNNPPGCAATQTCATPESDGNALFYDDTPTTAPLALLDQAGNANVSLWGGVIINGSAPTNLSDNNAATPYGTDTCEGLTFPGFPAALATYGGELPHDDSGTFRYISLRHGGDEIDDANEINGFSLCGVGDGTVLENLEVYANFDDGFEWFGGTVNGKNLVVTFTGDDSFDLDQGYTGVNQFMLALMVMANQTDTTAFGSASGDEAGEWDGDDSPASIRGSTSGLAADDLCSPLSNPGMWNLTVIGSSQDGSPDFDFGAAGESQRTDSGRIQMRNGYAGTLANSIIVNTGASEAINDGGGGACAGSTMAMNRAADRVLVVATTFDDVTASAGPNELEILGDGDALAADLGCGNNAVNDGGFQGLVYEDTSFHPRGGVCPGALCGKLHAGLKPAAIDPRPAAGSSTATVADGCTPKDSGLDRAATYRGAFDRSAPELWTTGWTVLNTAGLLAD